MASEAITPLDQTAYSLLGPSHFGLCALRVLGELFNCSVPILALADRDWYQCHPFEQATWQRIARCLRDDIKIFSSYRLRGGDPVGRWNCGVRAGSGACGKLEFVDALNAVGAQFA